MKVLNLYSGIGGNRRLWNNVTVTAIEQDINIAEAYKDFFPNDKIILTDAHIYLLNHYNEFDFIWSSPPCPSHSQYRYNVGVRAKSFAGVYPDMKLYEEIIFLKYHFKGDWVVENTVSYYEPLIKPQKISRHFIWSNMEFENIKIKSIGLRDKNKISDLEKLSGFDLSKYKIKGKRQVLRNCVSAELGFHIMKHIRERRFLLSEFI